MTPLIDQLCLAAGPRGAVKIVRRHIRLYQPEKHNHRLLDFERFENKCEWGVAITELARRERYREGL